MTRLLVIGPVWPEPTSSAAGQRSLRLLRFFLSLGWDVTFACAADAGAGTADLTDEGIRSQPISLNCPSFDKYLAASQPEIVLFERFMIEEQFGWRVEKTLPNTVRILDTVDLHFLRKARQRAARAGRAVDVADLRGPDAQREVAAILRSDLSLVLSDHEFDLLTENYGVPAASLQYLPFLLDPPDPSPPGYAARRGFVTIGTFRHAPNWDSVQWLAAEIWPRIRTALPDAELEVYGAYPHAQAMALDDPATGFRVRGPAKSVAPVMQAARVCLAPLRFGAGLKGKVTDAMAHGTPCVTTGIGAEGIADGGTWCGILGETAEAIASAATKLYTEEGAWTAAQARGLELIRDRFDGATHTAILAARIQDLRETLAAQRLENFTGAMLRHHHQRSTEFMARWIEAKRKLNPES